MLFFWLSWVPLVPAFGCPWIFKVSTYFQCVPLVCCISSCVRVGFLLSPFSLSLDPVAFPMDVLGLLLCFLHLCWLCLFSMCLSVVFLYFSYVFVFVICCFCCVLFLPAVFFGTLRFLCFSLAICSVRHIFFFG